MRPELNRIGVSVSVSRMRFTISYPSITGIVISSKIKEISSFFSFRISSASCPFSAPSTSRPCSQSMALAISMLRALSSTRRIRLPAREAQSMSSSRMQSLIPPSLSCSFPWILKFRVTVKLLPSPSLLSTLSQASMFPFW